MAEALAVMHKNGEYYWEAEIYRLRGELLLKSAISYEKSINLQSEIRNPQSEAESCFRQAIDVARRQSAKSLELRAVMSLSRLLQKQGEKEETRRMLAEIYGWFTEGFDTRDLKESKALLEELLK